MMEFGFDTNLEEAQKQFTAQQEQQPEQQEEPQVQDEVQVHDEAFDVDEPAVQNEEPGLNDWAQEFSQPSEEPGIIGQ